MPQNIVVAVCVRLSGALTSIATAIMIGNAAPRLTPARKRTASSVANVALAAVASVKKPNSSTAAMNTGLRPIRSASQPPALAPKTSPMLPIAKTQPSISDDSPSSGTSLGAATPIAWMSNPSATATHEHSATVMTDADPVVVAALALVTMKLAQELFGGLEAGHSNPSQATTASQKMPTS